MPRPRAAVRAVRVIALLAYAAALVPPFPILAQESGHETVVARRDAMRRMAEAAKTISDMFKGRQPFDGAGFRAAADLLVAHSGSALTAMFSDSAVGDGFEATEAVSERRKEFEAIAFRLHELAIAFDGKIGPSPASITPAMRMAPGDTMGGGSLLGGRGRAKPQAMDAVPAEHVFHEMLGTCTECHGGFRRRTRAR